MSPTAKLYNHINRQVKVRPLKRKDKTWSHMIIPKKLDVWHKQSSRRQDIQHAASTL